MLMQRGGCVYIITNKEHSVLYTGVTSDLRTRIYQHKNKTYANSFTSKYNCNKLVYYYFYHHVEEAIAAEKLIKGGNKKAKIELINGLNPEWRDLYDDVINE
jgi:putative endonuclease